MQPGQDRGAEEPYPHGGSPVPPPHAWAALRRKLSRAALRLFGWRARAWVPEARRYVLIGAPHTSNWDLAIALLLAGAVGLRLRWVGKSSLFRGPLGVLMRGLGGIPVDRGARSGAVRRLAERIRRDEHFVLAIAPEGTRSTDPYWKTGFYRIALAARVPIALGYCDYPDRVVGIGPTLQPTGDLPADFEKIVSFYAGKRGRHPRRQSPPALDPGSAAEPAAEPGASPADDVEVAPVSR